MPLATNLTTNEVKDKTGTEVEYLYLNLEGRTREYAKSGELPNLHDRIKVAHTESGSGYALTRRSMERVDFDFIGKSGKVARASVYKVFVVPLGEMDDFDPIIQANARLTSFDCTTGAGTTVLFDGSGNGASACINGTV